MKTTIFSKAAVLVILIGCGDDNPTVHGDAPPGGSDAPPMGKTFKQVEHLARPGINEVFLFTPAFMAGYNATAPSFNGVDPATLGMVANEAKTVMKALYLGACLLNGTIPGVTADTGVHPAGMKCHAIGTALWTENSLTGVTLTPESVAASDAYAAKVFSQFIPDVMRVDTGVASSAYLSLCGDPSSTPLLCGGRFLDDDVIDVTYNYLLNGAATPTGQAATFNQVSALVSDGVQFYTDPTKNKFNTTPPDPNNPQQFHPAVSQGFPYSAAPF
jgi:Domain of unknown function (DUF4331)